MSESLEQALLERERQTEDWQASALAALAVFSRMRLEFTAEQFRYDYLCSGGREPPVANCWASLFTAASRLGLITKTGRFVSACSRRTRRHPVPVWRRVV